MLKQMEERRYAEGLYQNQHREILKYGTACYKKQCGIMLKEQISCLREEAEVQDDAEGPGRTGVNSPGLRAKTGESETALQMLDIYFLSATMEEQKGADFMAQMTQVSIRIDEDVKRDAESVLDDLGISMSAAVTIFLKKVSQEHCIPFELSADPFYSENNVRCLENIMRDIKEGKAHFAEHDLTEWEES